jgi:hypothetical protein
MFSVLSNTIFSAEEEIPEKTPIQFLGVGAKYAVKTTGYVLTAAVEIVGIYKNPADQVSRIPITVNELVLAIQEIASAAETSTDATPSLYSSTS